MDTPQEFVKRTESAVQHLFAGIDEYMALMRRSAEVGFIITSGSKEEHQKALEAWKKENEEEIQQSLAAQREFSAEKYAMGVLCGSVLQVAATAIRMYSTNNKVAHTISHVAKNRNLVSKFSIGRNVRGVPIGLIIYAGRNQYNHMDEGTLKEPNIAIFEALACNHGYNVQVKDPAFNIENDLVLNYSSNITSLLGWRDYESFKTDLCAMLEI